MEECDNHYYNDRNFELMMVGETGVGKTSLARRFASKPFMHNQPATKSREYWTRILLRNERRLKVSLWDTPGSLNRQNLPPNYFRMADGILILYDIADRYSFNMLPHWIDMVQKYSSFHAHYFLVGTKIDLEPLRSTSQEEVEELARKSGNIPTFEVSAILGSGVASTFNSILDILDKEPERIATTIPMRANMPNLSRSCCYIAGCPSPPIRDVDKTFFIPPSPHHLRPLFQETNAKVQSTTGKFTASVPITVKRVLKENQKKRISESDSTGTE